MDAETFLDIKFTEIQFTIKPSILGTHIHLTSPRQVNIWALGDHVRKDSVYSVYLSLKKIDVFF